MSHHPTHQPSTGEDALRPASDTGPFFFRGSPAGCLLIHGLTGTAGEMRHLGERLHETHGFTINGPLLAGHGVSSKEFEAHGWRDWFLSAEEGFNRLREVCSSVFIVGFSMGGLLALLLALRHEAGVQGLALLATPLFASRTQSGLASIVWRLPAVRPWISRRALRLDEDSLPMRRDLSPAQASFAQLKWILRRQAACIKHPTLVIHSRRDPSVPWQNALALSALLGPACRKTLFLDRSGHVLPLDVDRDLVAGEIGAFCVGLAEPRCY